MKAIINGKIVLETEVLTGKVLVFDQKIIGFEDEVPAGCEVIDAKGLYVSPGFVDVHIHGSGGADTMDAPLESIQTISQVIAQSGTTSFLPTTMTMSKDDVYHALGNVRHWMGQTVDGAKILGAHMEGPFINVKYKGAQNPEHILAPSYEFIKEFTDVIKLITYAPELDENLSFTKEVKSSTDITLSIGHTDATFAQAKEAFRCGCSHVTHLFNAMTPLTHREPGVVGASLSSDVYTELIADKIHSSSHLFQFVFDNKSENRLVLITDSMRAGCMKDGNYDLGGQAVTVKDGAARLESGVLAGSVLTLNKAVKNLFENTNATLPEAIKMASLTPASSIGFAKEKGSLRIGKDADIILLDDNFDCHLSFSEGRQIFAK